MNPPSSLYLFLKRGFYYVQYVDRDGRRGQKSLNTKRKTTAVRRVAMLNRVLIENQNRSSFRKSHRSSC
jgi:hypothetical protein